VRSYDIVLSERSNITLTNLLAFFLAQTGGITEGCEANQANGNECLGGNHGGVV
jgi:hypothetical protein